jgi:hypothetical protein
MARRESSSLSMTARGRRECLKLGGGCRLQAQSTIDDQHGGVYLQYTSAAASHMQAMDGPNNAGRIQPGVLSSRHQRYLCASVMGRVGMAHGPL